MKTKSNAGRRILLSLLSLVVAFVFLGVAGGQLWRTEVSVAEVVRGRAVHAVPGVVQIAAERTVEVRTEIGGKVQETDMELGSRVRAGSVLARLDDADVRRALSRVRVELEAEEAMAEVGSLLRHDIEEAREEYLRQEELHRKGQYSRRELDLRKRHLARLEDEAKLEEIRDSRRLALLQNDRERLEEELRKMTIFAPVEGDIVEIFAYPGDVLGPRSAVVRLLSAERVIEATLSEENFAGVRAGQAANVRFLSYGRRLFSAEVAKVLPASDPETQRYTVHLTVEMPSDLMVPGLTGEVSIVLGERDDSLIIPRRALMGRDVFVVREGRVEARRVETGFVSLNHVEILAGLKEGEQVVVENLDRLRAGDRVRIKRESS